LKPDALAAGICAVTAAQDYLKRAEEAEARARRCVGGSAEEREFLEIAQQWRDLAQRHPPSAPPRRVD
jgi:hypothetical protein